MSHISADELKALADCPTLTTRQRQIVDLRLRNVRFDLIAKQLGIGCSSVTSMLTKARQKLCAPRETSRAINNPIDQAWHERQVAYVRSIEGDHRRHYLNGIAIVHGWKLADKIEMEAGRNVG